MLDIRRRQFITLLAGAAAAGPLAARAQQSAMPVVGFFHVRSLDDSLKYVVGGFRRGLSESGYVEGQNVTVEYRWGGGDYNSVSAIATEFVRRRVAVLVAGADAAALAAKRATSSIPIVFSVGSDPVSLGLVAAFNRPGGNATGVSNLTTTLEAKRLGLLHEIVGRAANIGILMHPSAPNAEAQLRDVQEAARAIGVQVQVLWAGTDHEIEEAFVSLTQKSNSALAVTANAIFDTRRDRLIGLAARHAVPTVYHFREFPTAGGLMSYGIDLPDVYREVGVYAGRILKGAEPADLPVKQPTKFEFVINLRTANALGLKIPDRLLALADEVIE
jgi:putative ABC transport system substrate-binding protein